MDVSRSSRSNQLRQSGQQSGIEGQELLDLVTGLTGLPQEWVERELHSILAFTGESKDGLTVPTLKAALLKYLTESPFALGSSPELH